MAAAAVYEITAPLGEGGMGQVFRARGTRLDCDVAIKILPEAFAQDPDRLARFQREARTPAPLNHSTSRLSTASREPAMCQP